MRSLSFEAIATLSLLFLAVCGTYSQTSTTATSSSVRCQQSMTYNQKNEQLDAARTALNDAIQCQNCQTVTLPGDIICTNSQVTYDNFNAVCATFGGKISSLDISFHSPSANFTMNGCYYDCIPTVCTPTDNLYQYKTALNTIETPPEQWQSFRFLPKAWKPLSTPWSLNLTLAGTIIPLTSSDVGNGEVNGEQANTTPTPSPSKSNAEVISLRMTALLWVLSVLSMTLVL